MSNPHLFRAQMFEIFLKGYLSTESLTVNTTRNAVRLISHNNLISTFNIFFNDDEVLDIDFEDIKDSNGATLREIKVCNEFITNVIKPISVAYNSRIEKWHDSSVTISLSDSLNIMVSAVDENVIVKFDNAIVPVPILIERRYDSITYNELIEIVASLSNFNVKVTREHQKMLNALRKSLLEEALIINRTYKNDTDSRANL
jgi:hypothetical protein